MTLLSCFRIEKGQVKVKDIEVTSVSDLHEGQVLRGFVVNCQDVGAFVSLGVSVVGRAQMHNLSDYFIKNTASAFHAGKLVTAKILR